MSVGVQMLGPGEEISGPCHHTTSAMSGPARAPSNKINILYLAQRRYLPPSRPLEQIWGCLLTHSLSLAPKLQSPHLHPAAGRKTGHAPGPATQSQKSSHPYGLAVPAYRMQTFSSRLSHMREVARRTTTPRPVIGVGLSIALLVLLTSWWCLVLLYINSMCRRLYCRPLGCLVNGAGGRGGVTNRAGWKIWMWGGKHPPPHWPGSSGCCIGLGPGSPRVQGALCI